MNDRLVTIARFTSYMEAELARQLLNSEGIQAFVMGQNVATTYGGVLAAVDIELQTLESQAEEAKQILEASRQQQEENADQGDQELEQDWDEGTGDEPDEDLEQE